AVVEPLPEVAGARRRLRLRSPVTLEPIGEIEVHTRDDVCAAVERARKAQPDWAALGFDERGRFLRRAVQVLLARQDEFVETIVRETGKPEFEALSAELVAACDALEFWAKRARKILAERTVPLHLMKNKKLR